MEAVQLTGVLSRVREMCEPAAASRGVELVLRSCSDRLFVRTDAQTLLLILMNLASNAVKFANTMERSRPRVVIRVSQREQGCRIFVLDNGIGIPSEHVDSIWEPFFQISNSERNREAGIGLGLYLVKRAISHLEDHQIAVHSRSGHGTCFLLTVPVITSQEAVQAPSPPVSLPTGEPDLHGMCVLVVEDDVQAREALQALLSEWGAQWISAPILDNAMQARLRSQPRVDAAIVDYRLPGGARGDQVVRQVRELLGNELDAILVTAEADLPSELREQLPGRTTLLLKPFEPMILASMLSASWLKSRGRT
jgi:CheY-like chemotaxis protein/two-component sensor histidine kinase